MKKYFEVMFKVNMQNIAIKKAIMQAIIVFTILSTSVIVGRFDLGLTALLGSFSHIYIINGSYPSRIRKVITVSIMLNAFLSFFNYILIINCSFPSRIKKVINVFIMLSFCLMLGSITITTPFLYAFVLGLIGMSAHFILKSLQVPGPSSLFFILTYSIASIMPIAPEDFLLRGSLVLCGGLVSALVVMVDAFFNHKKPETESVLNIYKNLSYLVENFKGERFNKARSQTLNTINQASLTLTTAKAFWNNKRDYNRLLLLKEKADEIWSECLELSSRGYESLPNEISVA